MAMIKKEETEVYYYKVLILYMKQYNTTLKQNVWPITGKMAINRNSLKNPRYWTSQTDFKSAILNKIKKGKKP